MHHVTPKKGILDIPHYNPASQGSAGVKLTARLCSNESALGASPKAMAAYRQAAQEIHRYPDGSNTNLRAALAEHFGLDARGIVCTSGTEDLLRLIAFAYAGPGDEVVHSQYGFMVYRFAALAVGATPVSVPERHYTADVDALIAAVTERTKILYLANPNNPTGTYLPFAEVQRLVESLPQSVLMVLDEAYADFIEDQPDYEFGHKLVARGNVIITRTFSKMYALAAARLGWAYSTPDIAAVLNRIQSAFPISTAAQVAGIAALHDRDHLRLCKQHNAQWLPWLSQRLTAAGLNVTPSVGNFVLAHFPGGEQQAMAAYAALQAEGVRTRPMAPYGLAQSLRITIGLEAENKALVAGVEKFMAGIGDRT